MALSIRAILHNNFKVKGYLCHRKFPHNVFFGYIVYANNKRNVYVCTCTVTTLLIFN